MSRLTLAFVCLLFVVSSLTAQNNAVRGGIAGQVTDPSGAAIANATIVVSGSQGSITVQSSSAGSYSVSGLTPGFYKITVTAPGFTTYVSTQNEVV
ncbi:MAG TPA: carboxypeptidase regulatory-like domain-containing protein, partial [Granulicella sp.]|nr:carboxypeptidase regulatory-like domain-containing protein [Granulicella sp.]